jgi:YebC/PmpR family DNA-binding regulatory protein
MAGHSHWANIARKKAIVDNKRGKLWSKLSRLIIVAARSGGGDPSTNLRLRYAIDDAKAANMPNDTINRAIKKGTGELAGENSYDEVVYEGYGPGGVAVMCEILTDNRNRTAPEIRKIFELNDGKLGATGCVSWMFERKGTFLVPADSIDEESLLEIALEAGAQDVKRVGDQFEITCDAADYDQVRSVLESRGVKLENAHVARVPTTTVDVDAETARKVLRLIEMLDDHDDVQSVVSNFNLPDEALAELRGT